MKKAASKAKSTAMNIVKVPQTIGRTILSVPEIVKKKLDKKPKQAPPPPEFADHLEFINKEIVEGQQHRGIVRESLLECMKVIVDHLEAFLIEQPDAAHSYEEWIACLHPDNADYADHRIDHRFYVQDSDHRLLWNEYMQELDRIDRVVESRSVEPSYGKKMSTRTAYK